MQSPLYSRVIWEIVVRGLVWRVKVGLWDWRVGMIGVVALNEVGMTDQMKIINRMILIDKMRQVDWLRMRMMRLMRWKRRHKLDIATFSGVL